MHSKFILLALHFIIYSAWANEFLVSLPNGPVRGRKEVSARGATFYAFQQIPFAKPPVGKLRFQAPEPAESWEGVLDGTVSNKICYQWTSNENAVLTEDCLYVNVYTPVEPSMGASLPVIVYIHGGGFVSGDALFTTRGPHYFMEYGVVVVTVNYRVGPFGFLSTGDRIIPGNYGLKDQNLGLKWVQDNVKYFGGNPDEVTIFGGSAGGASVTYHMLSAQSKGLFRGAISSSGSALCPWSYQRNHKSMAYQMAAVIDPSLSPNATSEELLQLFQEATTEQIAEASSIFQESVGRTQIVQGFWFTPVVDPDHEGAFLTRRMYDAIADGSVSQVPMLMGLMSEEQLSKAQNLDSFEEELAQLENDIGLLVNDDMHIISSGMKALAGEAIRQIYTNGSFLDDIAGAVKYFSDTSFSRPVIHHARLQLQYSDVFFYVFSYHGELGGNDMYVEGAGRVNHVEDAKYTWAVGNYSDLSSADPADVLTVRRYLKLFTDFAKTLHPTPEPSSLLQRVIWPKARATNFQYLDFGVDMDIKSNPKDDAYRKWVQLYEDMAIKPYDTF
uniref:Carboxylic ester hydrolase n=1 Tax=Anoplophora glabripennis TaxID=217634 RepID=V5I8T2_ANOGL